jgi:O-antigen ligase
LRKVLPLQNWPVWAGPIVTLACSPGLTFQPLATIKLVALGVFAAFGATEILSMLKNWRAKSEPILISSLVIFLCTLSVPLLFSGAPLSQQIYGASGRSIGFLHYFFLACIVVGTILNVTEKRISKILISLIVTGFIQCLYASLQFFKLDPISWSNPNDWLFGTFGNPNFLSSLLGMAGFANVFQYIYGKKSKFAFLYLLNSIFCIGIIVLSKSVQGLILFGFGMTVIVLMFTYTKSKAVFRLSSIAALLSFLVAGLGLFKIGPLAKFMYQDSTSFRGDYWRAGLSMFKNSPFYGVGLDSYGDNYRQYRDSLAAERRGLDMFSNSAHNLFIDLGATGGILLLGFYLILNIAVFSLVIRRIKSLQPASIAFLTLWLCFNIQSVISINVSSIAIWGALFLGVLIKSGRLSRPQGSNQSGKSSKSSKSGYWLYSLIACMSFVLFALAPFLVRDIQLSSALESNDLSKVKSVVVAWPRSCELMTKAQNASTALKDFQGALDVARISVNDNPKCYESWLILSTSPQSSFEEKRIAEARLKILEPNS